jgi:catechol 2,3-dioxygenase-like lactoylglutathione lyase family enzyme
MSTTQDRSRDTGGTASAGTIDMKLEVVTIPVSDVDRAKEFYASLGWRLDATRPSWSSSRAAAAHGEHEKRIGKADANWPDWYADYRVREQAGTELPS